MQCFSTADLQFYLLLFTVLPTVQQITSPTVTASSIKALLKIPYCLYLIELPKQCYVKGVVTLATDTLSLSINQKDGLQFVSYCTIRQYWILLKNLFLSTLKLILNESMIALRSKLICRLGAVGEYRSEWLDRILTHK